VNEEDDHPWQYLAMHHGAAGNTVNHSNLCAVWCTAKSEKLGSCMQVQDL